MKRDIDLSDREVRMLELLVRGASNKGVASALGYRDGTMRVYLHDLYRKLGVNGRTAAVVWYLERSRAEARPREASARSAAGARREESFGDMAVSADLLAALGVMNIFLGPHGRVWEVATRLKGGLVDARTEARRLQSRALWKAFLEGDVEYGVELHEAGKFASLLADSPGGAVLLAMLLLLGGHRAVAERLILRLAASRKAGRGISAGELALVRAFRDALAFEGVDAIASLHLLAIERSANPVLRQAAMVALFHVYRARSDFEHAQAAANALWGEAEAVRQHLQEMGERPLYQEGTLLAPDPVSARKLTRYLQKVSGGKALARQS